MVARGVQNLRTRILGPLWWLFVDSLQAKPDD